MSRRGRGAEVVAPWSPWLGVVVGIFLTGMAGMMALATISVSPADPWSEYVANGTCLAAASWALLLIASTRVDGVGDELKVVNFFRTVAIPAARVRGAEAENGLAIVVDDEGRVDCVAYGDSVVKDLCPRLRPVRHVRGVVEWASRHGGGPAGEPASDIEVRSSIRTFVWCGLPAVWLVSMSYMAVVRMIADPLRTLFQVPM